MKKKPFTGGLEPIAFSLPPEALLEEGFRKLGIHEDDFTVNGIPIRGYKSSKPLFDRYIRELELFNSVFDLVGANTRSDLVVRHLLDSIAPWRTLADVLVTSKEKSVADAGSGAGFPGIPLSILFPDTTFSLIERMSKRCAFLENCLAFLSLKNASVVHSEVEKAPVKDFSIAVFRAFRPLDAAMMKTLRSLVKKDGILAAYKAKEENIQQEMEAIKGEYLSYSMTKTPVPFMEHEERNLVLIKI